MIRRNWISINRDGSQQKAEEQFELWIFYGQCDADDLQAAGVETEDESPKASAMAVMLNDRLVKVTLNVMDSGDFPYDVLAWQRRPSMPSPVSMEKDKLKELVSLIITPVMSADAGWRVSLTRSRSPGSSLKE